MVKYIRYKDHKTLYTDDNWKTIKVAQNESPEGKEEANQDITTEVKLRYNLGEGEAKVIINEFENIRKTFDLPKKDGYGHSFEIFSIATLYNIDYDVTYNNYIIKGQEDGKIDAIYWKDGAGITVYQIKLDNFNSSDLPLMKSNLNEFIKSGNITSDSSSYLLKFCKDHKKEIVGKEIIYKTISNTQSPYNITPEKIFKKFFENKIISKDNNITIKLEVPMNNGFAQIDKKGTVFAYFTSAKAFLQDILSCESIRKKENLYKLFYDNVRGYLGENKELTDTIKNDSENFVKYNNGITVTGQVKLLKGTAGTFVVTHPVINNGQQTIWNLMEEYPNIDDVDLLIILKNEDKAQVKTKISQYTNSQRLIKPIDLLSLDNNLRALQKSLFDLRTKDKEKNYFLEVNTSGTKEYQKIVKKIYPKTNLISLADFCKLYFGVEDKKLGNWKSNISIMIRKLLYKDIDYSNEKALEICRIISRYNKYLQNTDDKNKKNAIKTADIAFEYIMYKYQTDEDTTYEIIDKINHRYYYNVPDEDRRSKLIDIYKSNIIVEYIDTVINDSFPNLNKKIKPVK